MSMGMPIEMCVEMRVNVCIDMYVDVSIDMDKWHSTVDMCIDMWH